VRRPDRGQQVRRSRRELEIGTRDHRFDPSGSGTSTSGGKDANGDRGRDRMPKSSIGVRPLDRQNKP
jgi:hypothetical protein